MDVLIIFWGYLMSRKKLINCLKFKYSWIYNEESTKPNTIQFSSIRKINRNPPYFKKEVLFLVKTSIFIKLKEIWIFLWTNFRENGREIMPIISSPQLTLRHIKYVNFLSISIFLFSLMLNCNDLLIPSLSLRSLQLLDY